MNKNISIRHQYCPNPSCIFYKKILAENVIVHSQYSKRMRCKRCKKTWSSDLNELKYGLRSEIGKIDSAIALLEAGMSIRFISKKIGISTSTVQRWKKRYEGKTM